VFSVAIRPQASIMTIQATNATISKIIGDNSHTVVAGESLPLIYGQRRAFF
jgi:hypothetical protein